MNLPNILTLSRIFLVPLLVAVLLRRDAIALDAGWVVLTREVVALVIFLSAALTDLLDGYIARRTRQVTTFGKLLDPIADKLLVSAALISLVELDRVAAWMVVLIVSREFAVSALRYLALTEGITIAASDVGKAKMVTQVAAVSLLLLALTRQLWSKRATSRSGLPSSSRFGRWSTTFGHLLGGPEPWQRLLPTLTMLL